MDKKIVEQIRENMDPKSTDELVKIWKENDREQYSEAAFEAIKQLLLDRGQTLPPQAEPQKEESQINYEKIKSLPNIPFRRAINLENTMRTWSQILFLWLIFGIFWVIKGYSDIQQFGQAISNISMASSGFLNVDPEMQEIVNRLSPYLDTFRRLQSYLYFDLFVSFIGWLSIFKIRPMFLKRSPQGPKMLLILLCIYLLVDVIGVALTLNLDASEVRELIDVYQIRIFPVVRLLIVLTLLPLFGKYASLYSEYVSIDREVFTRPGAAWNFLEPSEIKERKNKILARRRRSLRALLVYGVVAVVSVVILLVSLLSGIHYAKDLLIALICLVTIVSIVWLIVESTLLASSMYSSPLLVSLGGIITYGIVSVLVVAYLLPKAKRELSLAPQQE